MSQQTLNSLKKAFLIGLGATVATAEKIKDWADDLVARGELSQSEAKAFTEELKERAVKEKEQWEGKTREAIDSAVKKCVHSLGLVTRAELHEQLSDLKRNLKAPGAGRDAGERPVPKTSSRPA